MFGLEFLFSAALFALPLAALPLVLHLLNRRKSPVVQFSTLRFIKASLQQSAARRKVQRWFLLIVRMLLLALLIWAVAQPARTLASRFFSSAAESVAVIVVDTSWSMQYQQNQVSLLVEADQIVRELLRKELKDASVQIVTGAGGEAATFRSSSDLLANWTELQPSTSIVPTSDRVLASVNTLVQNPASQKLLVILSDFQSRDFPRPLPQIPADLRVVAIDLHPNHPRSAGVQAISLSPAQPIAGLPVSCAVEVAGPPGDARPVSLVVTTLEGKELLARPPVIASFDDFGQATVRFDMQVPADRWQLVTAKVQGEDPMKWDDARTLAIELPPQQSVVVLEGSEATAQPRRLVKLALDPEEGSLASWPLRVESGQSIAKQNAAVFLLDKLPDAQAVARWRSFVSGGGTLVLMLRPGIETDWASSPAAGALEQLLPGKPYVSSDKEMLRFAPTASTRQEAVTAGLADDPKAMEDLRAARIVPMTIDDASSTRMLIASFAGDRKPLADRNGLLYVRRIGSGRVFSWACIPDATNTNLGTHPLFLPLLVNECLRPLETSFAANVELGQALVWPHSPAQKEMEIHTPKSEAFRVPITGGKATFANAVAPGVYSWHVPGEPVLRGLSSVSVTGAEAQTSYRPAETLMPQGSNILVAHSLTEMQSRIAEVTQPQPKWTVPLALAILLLCAEGLISSESGLWTWFKRS